MGNPKHKGSPVADVGAEYGRQLEARPAFGVVIEVEWEASGATKTVVHGMGHVFAGAVVIKQNNSSVDYRVGDEESARALDLDIDNEILVSVSGSHTGTAWVWVF